MTIDATGHGFVVPRLQNAVVLGVLGLALAATHRPPHVLVGSPTAVTAPPALRVRATPRQGFAPLHVHVEVEQDVVALARHEVCLRVISEDFTQESCWSGVKQALVVREFTLPEGHYDVYARAGRDVMSNWVPLAAVVPHEEGAP